MEAMDDILGYDYGVSAQPFVIAAWSGRCIIPSRGIDICLSAHLSNNTRFKVSEAASMMPESLCLEMVPCPQVWPSSEPPTENSIDLFFFPEERDEKVLDSLLTDAVCDNLALKATIGESQLLIFTSLELPEKLCRFQGKFYFWGRLVGQEAAASHKSDNDVHIQDNGERPGLSLITCKQRSFAKESLSNNADAHNPSQDAQANKRGKQFDDCWEHAKPLDESGQKMECKHCGFVSLHGGISRLKAHLGGGNPRTPGCDKVSSEVKKVVAEWYNEWVKSYKASWVKEIQGNHESSEGKNIPLNISNEQSPCNAASSEGKKTPVIISIEQSSACQAAPASKRGRKLDDAWRHATPLDESRQKTKCNYCGFVSAMGGISRLKAHLGGGNFRTPGCDEVSLEVRKVMADWYSGWVKNTNANWAKKLQDPFDLEQLASQAAPANKGGKKLDDSWQHAKQLDEWRQKTECKYCGFVSAVGGISRLKAHLGGGNSRTPGCEKVTPEVKKVMADWYSGWVINTNARWTREIQVTPAKPVKRGRPLDDAWEHAVQLDEIRQSVKCKYCDFVCEWGGIARLKGHLSGGDLTMLVKSCPNLPREVKNSLLKAMKTAEGRKMETFEDELQEADTTNEAQLSSERHSIVQETVDGIKDACRKMDLQKLIDVKNAELRKMQSEIQSLESQLSSVP